MSCGSSQAFALIRKQALRRPQLDSAGAREVDCLNLNAQAGAQAADSALGKQIDCKQTQAAITTMAFHLPRGDSRREIRKKCYLSTFQCAHTQTHRALGQMTVLPVLRSPAVRPYSCRVSGMKLSPPLPHVPYSTRTHTHTYNLNRQHRAKIWSKTAPKEALACGKYLESCSSGSGRLTADALRALLAAAGGRTSLESV